MSTAMGGPEGEGTGHDGAAPEGGAHGAGGPGDRRPADTTTRRGTTMTSAKPVDPHGQGGGGYPGSPQDAAQYHPPRAYPAPPAEPPTVGGQEPRAHQRQDPQRGGGQHSTRRARTGTTTATTTPRPLPRVRKARLRVFQADPWSVMKVSFLLSIALGICSLIAVAMLWLVMDAMGVFATIGETISQATSTDDGSGFDLESFLSLPRVLLFTTLIAMIDVVLATALATLGAFLYNISAGFTGGVEVTLAEDQ